MLANAVQCFLDQTYKKATLLILDDANTFDTQIGDRWVLHSTPHRIPSLWQKYNQMVMIGGAADIIVIWEDDDVYFNNHLANIAEAYVPGNNWYVAKSIWSTFRDPIGNAHHRNIGISHHGSWAYNRGMFMRAGMYTTDNVLDGDMRLRPKLLEMSKPIRYGLVAHPTYAYRWNRGAYNGSSKGRDGWAKQWKRTGKMKVPRMGKLRPAYDRDTKLLIEGVSTGRIKYDLTP